MRIVNIRDPQLSWDPSDPEGFRSGMWRFGGELGATASGTSLYELPPGQAVCPYHYEHGEEEWLLVLSGEPTLRTPDGTKGLRPLDVAFFPKGPEGAHQVRNDTDEAVRILMWGTVVYPSVSVYPDSDKLGIWTEGRVDNLIVERSSGVDYFRGEGG